MRLKQRPLCGVMLILVIFIFFLIVFAGKKWIPGLMESALDRHWSEGDSITLTGLVYDIGKGETFQKVYVKDVILWDGKSQSYYKEERVLVYVKNNAPLIGEVVQVKGTLSFFQEARNPGNFNQKSYYQKQNIHGMVWSTQVESLQDLCRKSPWWKMKRKLRIFRDSWQEKLLEVLGDKDGSVLSAMLLGEKSGMDQEVKDIYQANGIAHILAISSLHLMFVGGNIYRSLRRLTGSYRFGGFLGILFLWIYILMVGVTVSAVRALVMFLFQVGAAMAGRKYDIPTAYVTALFVVLIWRPLSLYDGGFWMSFDAVFAVLFISPILMGEKKKDVKKKKRKTIEKIKENARQNVKESFGISLGIQLTMFPLLLYYYYEFAPLSLLLNLLVIPLMSLLLASGMIGSFLLIFLKPLGVLLLCISKAILILFRFSGEKALLIPGSRWVVGQPKIWQIVAYYGIFGLVLVWKQEERRKAKKGNDDSLFGTQEGACRQKLNLRKMIRAVILLVGLFLLLVHPEEMNRLRLMFLDVGQGDSIYIKSPGGLHILVDGGSSDVKEVGHYRIEPYLKCRGVGSLDYVFVSHGDTDHMNGIEELVERQKLGVKIKNLVLPEEIYWDDSLNSLAKKAASNGIPVWTFSQGKEICDKSGKFYISCLGPGDEKIKVGNAASMVLKITSGELDLLLTGDVEGQGEEALLQVLDKNYKEISWDLLKVAHHGSKNSSGKELLRLLQPREAIISAGINNSYGHPHKETLQRLKEVGCIIRSTQNQGGIEYLF